MKNGNHASHVATRHCHWFEDAFNETGLGTCTFTFLFLTRLSHCAQCTLAWAVSQTLIPAGTQGYIKMLLCGAQ